MNDMTVEGVVHLWAVGLEPPLRGGRVAGHCVVNSWREGFSPCLGASVAY
jgi:hypothetical protein